jgi:hypothetical protein
VYAGGGETVTEADLHALREGDCIQSKLTGQTYLVTRNYGTRITAVCTVDVTHAEEWDVLYAVVAVAPTIPPDRYQEDTP